MPNRNECPQNGYHCRCNGALNMERCCYCHQPLDMEDIQYGTGKGLVVPKGWVQEGQEIKFKDIKVKFNNQVPQDQLIGNADAIFKKYYPKDNVFYVPKKADVDWADQVLKYKPNKVAYDLETMSKEETVVPEDDGSEENID